MKTTKNQKNNEIVNSDFSVFFWFLHRIQRQGRISVCAKATSTNPNTSEPQDSKLLLVNLDDCSSPILNRATVPG